ncbi:MAG: hypothetical protein A2942_02005 [Candidatus Lloydbacteria bacterium RIFCSPLOWO2_01_FULL_50_20]|uniref:Uncharacterized protein n=1 Tax=Candidatus Lloydbacteria bacterium RIFCSPLOWO2_01_FULL_50_20 TaxID=1798665 RepID=A0A1G2DE45_9BACT|nr:MAG: hypothetical protein A2942_02005 [Candidatus Lloydbacteria bacterium RIFCSPLOWO2_01_FULL_50_20]
MYKGFVLSESLKDPTVLNNFEKIYVKVENHPEYEGEPKIWHDFKLKVDNKDIVSTANLFAEQMKDTWYGHFWNNLEVYVVLPAKVFKIPREQKWQSTEYQA